MSTDPLPLPGMLTGPPDVADYDAMHAAITACERGRWFLREYTNRNRHADTQMLVAAIARVEAAIRGEPPPHAPFLLSPAGRRDLIAIAAAIERVEALIGAGAAEGPGGAAAAERVADIAFVLHERDVEASLCDALDAAVREICDACARNEAAAQRTHQAAELLRELSARINDMIAPSIADHRGEPPAGAAGAAADAALASIDAVPEPAIADAAAGEEATNRDGPPGAGLFEADLQADEDFVQAVAALAASPPAVVEAGASAVDQTVHRDLENDHETHWSGEAERQCVADTVDRPDGDDVGPLREAGASRALLPESEPPVGPQEDPGDLFEPMANPPPVPPVEATTPDEAPPQPSDLAANPEHTRAPSSEAFSGEAFSSEAFSSEREPERGEDAQAAMSAPEAEASGEVFSVDAAALALSSSAAPDAKPPPPQAPSPQPRVAAPSAAQAVLGSAPSDPLAPVRALSEEEIIALFS
jgi:hypothetical protein